MVTVLLGLCLGRMTFGVNDIAMLYLLRCKIFKLIFKTLKSESVATPFLVDYK